jgi:hypothetical protein
MEMSPNSPGDPPLDPATSARGNVHEPTPDEIAAMCADIRSNWSDGKRIGRSRGINRHRPTDERRPWME